MPSFLGKGSSKLDADQGHEQHQTTKDNRHESVDPIVALIVSLLLEFE